MIGGIERTPVSAARPDWLRIRVPAGEKRESMFEMMRGLSLHTVCEQANCPNLGECFERGTATFLILGRECTRNCTFCNVSHQTPTAVDPMEADHVVEAVTKLQLHHVVVTSVTRDDLPDGGAGQFAAVIHALRKQVPDTTVEVLIPDFQGDPDALSTVLDAGPDVLAHNVETVPSLYGDVRPMADYQQSLTLLKRASSKMSRVKSGFMLGLGETEPEVRALLHDLREAGCTHLSIGQYLQPSAAHHPVRAYIPPETFARWAEIAYEMGFGHVASGPLVRSSYHAEKGVF